MAHVQSVTTFVMSAQLPWPDDAPPADALGSLDPIALYEAGQPKPCAIRKISSLGATIRGAVSKVAGDDVSVELATGQRPAGTIDWVAGGEAGIRFKQPIDMLALLNRKLVDQPGERRTMPRVELRCGVGPGGAATSPPRRCATSQREGCRSKAMTFRLATASSRCSSTA
jgi:hypothetical protein